MSEERKKDITSVSPPTGPKPFVFVLMPFLPAFSDIYKFGIKGAAEDVGAYAERVDEQMYNEGMLERIFNQINKADVIVADMTNRNPNVFYEVGYAHALDKVVLLLTQNAEDIPFDLKHRPHIVYGGRIDALRTDLAPRLRWAIEENKRRITGEPGTYSLIVSMAGVDLQELDCAKDIPIFQLQFSNSDTVGLTFHIRNEGPEQSDSISHLYFFTESSSSLLPKPPAGFMIFPDLVEKPSQLSAQAMKPSEHDRKKLDLAQQYRIRGTIDMIPPGAVEELSCSFSINKDLATRRIERFCLRLHLGQEVIDLMFKLDLRELTETKKSSAEEKV